MKKIKVLIVDDSAFVRTTLTEILNHDPHIEVIATAIDPVFAAKKMLRVTPDVITLDLEMPRIDGLSFLKKLMSEHPVPVVVISSLTPKGSDLSMKALEYGAIDVITKPKIYTKEFLEESRILICDAVKAAAEAKIKRFYDTAKHKVILPKLSADEILLRSQNPGAIRNTTDKIIVIGASTGGTTAIESLLKVMSPGCPGIAIVQHMPEVFTKSFADRLNTLCNITVKEAVDGELITPGKALIAPGNRHMLIRKTGAKYTVQIEDGPLVNRHRPSVDVLFRSAANFAGPNATGIILTGMGDDGAKGMLEMKMAGSFTIAQDEESCIVFGMPKAAINMDAICEIVPLDQMAPYLNQRFAFQAF